MNMARECIILNVKANTEQQWTHHGITQHCNDEYTSTTNNTALLGCHSVSSWNKCVNTSLKPRTHRRQSWIQHGPLCWKSTMLLWPRTQYTLATKLTISATKSTVSATKSTAPSVELELLPICCHIDNKVDRICNKVDRICNKVDRICNKVDCAICRIRVVADLLPYRQQSWPYGQQSTLLPICCWFRQQSTFNKVDCVEFNSVTSVYRA